MYTRVIQKISILRYTNIFTNNTNIFLQFLLFLYIAYIVIMKDI